MYRFFQKPDSNPTKVYSDLDTKLLSNKAHTDINYIISNKQGNSLHCLERSLLPSTKISLTTHVQCLQWLHGKQQQSQPCCRRRRGRRRCAGSPARTSAGRRTTRKLHFGLAHFLESISRIFGMRKILNK